jgi:hypothetical protein
LPALLTADVCAMTVMQCLTTAERFRRARARWGGWVIL